MSQINRIPLGYLNMLQAQTGGKTPFETFDQVMPAIGMDEFYLAQGLSIESDNFTAIANNQLFSIAVPAGEVWLVRHISVQQTAILAADQAQWQVGLRQLPKSAISAIVLETSPILNATTALELLQFGVPIQQPFFLQAGSEIFVVVQNVVNFRNTFILALVAKFSA